MASEEFAWLQRSMVRKSSSSVDWLGGLVVSDSEDQILGQMKRAFDFSRMNHYVGSIFNDI
jgi:hypothetical protein